MKLWKQISIILLVSLSLFACKKEESNQVLLVSTQDIKDTLSTDEIVTFLVEAFSNTSKISKISIEEFSPQLGTRMIMDTSLNTSKWGFNFPYTVPLFSSDQIVKLIFKAYSYVDDKPSSVSFTYQYKHTQIYLTEYSGFSMYVPLSGKPDAFSLTSKQLVTKSDVDSAIVDFYVYQDSLVGDQTVLQRIWRSNTGLNFVKANSFDYAKATEESVRSVYTSSTKTAKLTEISTDDIVLIGFEKNPVAVIKIIAVFDEAGSNNDRYLFNIKFL